MFPPPALFSRLLPVALVLCVAACNDDSGTDAWVCSGSPADCLRFQSGWVFEGITSIRTDLGDVAAVRLADGRIRILGGRIADPGSNTREYLSYVSSDGIHFTEEAGIRLAGTGIHGGYTVVMTDGTFRMYFADQSQGVINGRGSRAIRSARSTDGLNFAIENGDRITYSGSGNEVDGIGGGRPVLLPNGTWRMYYHGHANGKDYLLSATSPDGLVWTREPGVRIQAQDVCPAEDGVHNFSPVYAISTLHLFVAATKCRDDYENAVAGIWDATSADGLTFLFPDKPIIEGYYRKDHYHGNPTDYFVGPQDPAVVRTADGFRVYFGLYWADNTNIPEAGIYSMSRLLGFICC